MGFGVSGSAAIIFLGILICTGTLYTTAAGTAESLNDAHDADDERLLERRNTAVNVTSVTYSNNSGDYSVNVTVDNTGTTTLSVNDSSILVNNEYVSRDSYDTATVEGINSTDVWAPTETLRVKFLVDVEPARVKLVTEHGVEDVHANPEEI